MIDAVLFDLDGTLFDRDRAVSMVLARQVEQFAHLIPAGQASAFIRGVQTLDAHGHRDKREVYATVGTEFGFDAAAVSELLASFWAEYPACCQLEAGVADTLAALRQRGKRLGIVTNGSTAIQRAAIQALGLESAVDIVVISEVEGVRKPDAAIFRLAAARLGVSVERCCFVGDHPEVDVLGAQTRRTPGVLEAHDLLASARACSDDRRHHRPPCARRLSLAHGRAICGFFGRAPSGPWRAPLGPRRFKGSRAAEDERRSELDSWDDRCRVWTEETLVPVHRS